MKPAWVLIGMLVTLMVFQVLGLGLGPTIVRGLGYDDVFRVTVVAMLILGIALGSPLHVDVPRIHVAFLLLITYAFLSWLFLTFLVEYEDYTPIAAAFKMKGELFDHYLTFLVFFYGARSTRDAWLVLKSLLAVLLAGNLLSNLDAVGLINLGITEFAQDRVQGLMYEANQTGVLVATFVPVFVAAAMVAGRMERLVWLTGAAMLLMALLLSASRGGAVGLLAAVAAAGLLFRNYVSIGRIFGISVGGALVVILIVASLSVEFRSVIFERFITQSTATGSADLSSGRTLIWSEAVGRMMQSPWSLVTGLGWKAYDAMAFRRATHNTYLSYWFDLGVIGLACFMVVIGAVIVRVRRICAWIPAQERTVLIGVASGMAGFAVAIFFVNIHYPWPYTWSLIALAMRMTVNAVEPATQSIQPATTVATSNNPYGWRARAASSRTSS